MVCLVYAEDGFGVDFVVHHFAVFNVEKTICTGSSVEGFGETMALCYFTATLVIQV